jgi:hypothetical protein
VQRARKFNQKLVERAGIHMGARTIFSHSGEKRPTQAGRREQRQRKQAANWQQSLHRCVINCEYRLNQFHIWDLPLYAMHCGLCTTTVQPLLDSTGSRHSELIHAMTIHYPSASDTQSPTIDYRAMPRVGQPSRAPRCSAHNPTKTPSHMQGPCVCPIASLDRFLSGDNLKI